MKERAVVTVVSPPVLLVVAVLTMLLNGANGVGDDVAAGLRSGNGSESGLSLVRVHEVTVVEEGGAGARGRVWGALPACVAVMTADMKVTEVREARRSGGWITWGTRELGVDDRAGTTSTPAPNADEDGAIITREWHLERGRNLLLEPPAFADAKEVVIRARCGRNIVADNDDDVDDDGGGGSGGGSSSAVHVVVRSSRAQVHSDTDSGILSALFSVLRWPSTPRHLHEKVVVVSTTTIHLLSPAAAAADATVAVAGLGPATPMCRGAQAAWCATSAAKATALLGVMISVQVLATRRFDGAIKVALARHGSNS